MTAFNDPAFAEFRDDPDASTALICLDWMEDYYPETTIADVVVWYGWNPPEWVTAWEGFGQTLLAGWSKRTEPEKIIEDESRIRYARIAEEFSYIGVPYSENEVRTILAQPQRMISPAMQKIVTKEMERRWCRRWEAVEGKVNDARLFGRVFYDDPELTQHIAQHGTARTRRSKPIERRARQRANAAVALDLKRRVLMLFPEVKAVVPMLVQGKIATWERAAPEWIPDSPQYGPSSLAGAYPAFQAMEAVADAVRAALPGVPVDVLP